jgi:Kdo2-lipid IVA lauroyltransferase/acyltransferase
MSRDRSAFRNWAEYVGVRAVVAVARLLPRRAMPAVARWCGDVLFRTVRRRRAVVRDNVALAYRGAPSAPDADDLYRASLTTLSRSFLELFLLPPASEADALRARMKVRGGLTIAELRAKIGDGPVVFAGSHFAAYEMCGAMLPLLGFPGTTLMRPLDNPLLDRFLNHIRMRFGQRLASNRGGLVHLSRDLAAGRSVAVMVDLNMLKPDALFPTFFGVPAATARTTAILARRAGRPLVPVFMNRTAEPFSFEFEIAEPILPDRAADRDADAARMIQEATDAIESRVRRSPDQWLWTHRRWKTRPAAETRP